MTATSIPTRAAVVRRGLQLEYLTLGWNSLEALVALVAGLIAGSIALVGFGFDSIIECSSGAILLWRLNSDADHTRRERNEQISLRLVGTTFLLLAAYVGFEAIADLVRRDAPAKSLPGILLAVVSLIVMPLLARAKRRVARALNSNALHADSRQTDLCAYLSGILLLGLVLNALFGWWWADPAAALIMVPMIAREGVNGLRGKGCCDSPLEAEACCDHCPADAQKLS